MVETAKETGKILTIGYQNRYRADSQYLKSVCEADELGDIYYARLMRSAEEPFRPGACSLMKKNRAAVP